MIAVCLVSALTFVFATLFGHVLHWMIHQPWTGRLYRAHRAHHFDLYPPSDYTSDKYRGAGTDSTVFTFALLGAPLVLFPAAAGLLGWVPVSWSIACVLTLLAVGFLNDYIHDSFHLNRHWLHGYDFYKRMDDLHYHHHVDTSKNFGIFLFVWDRVFGTFEADKSKK